MVKDHLSVCDLHGHSPVSIIFCKVNFFFNFLLKTINY